MLRCMSLAKDSAEKTFTCSEIRCDEYSSVYDKHFKDIGALSNESGNDLQQILEKLASYSITLYDAVTTARKIPGEMRTLVNGFLKMHEKFPMPIADVEVGDTLLHEGAQWVVEKIVMVQSIQLFKLKQKAAGDACIVRIRPELRSGLSTILLSC